MNAIADFFSAAIRILFMVCMFFFIIGLMLLALFFVAIATLWSAFTGRPNNANMWWQRMDKTRTAVWRSNKNKSSRSYPAGSDADITDVTSINDTHR